MTAPIGTPRRVGIAAISGHKLCRFPADCSRGSCHSCIGRTGMRWIFLYPMEPCQNAPRGDNIGVDGGRNVQSREGKEMFLNTGQQGTAHIRPADPTDMTPMELGPTVQVGVRVTSCLLLRSTVSHRLAEDQDQDPRLPRLASLLIASSQQRRSKAPGRSHLPKPKSDREARWCPAFGKMETRVWEYGRSSWSRRLEHGAQAKEELLMLAFWRWTLFGPLLPARLKM
ncbi:hypothetical protein K456DRAFT_93455 [Colletotrichum gloeosporioides 23]|nr:hypothetical protein K456DRAFT_93455 [Colletotrichum gloeosporioides 23]